MNLSGTHPLFSIITVTLNCAEDAVRTAQSVLAQDFGDYEYLVKDGGSTDGTVERLRELGVSVQVNPDDGIYDAMNQALKSSRGDYVSFLNAGDLFDSPQVLARVADGLQGHNWPRFAYGDIRSRSRHPLKRGLAREVQYPDRLGRFYLYRKMICHQAWFVQRSLLAQHGGFDTRFHLLADYDFLLKTILRDQGRHARIPCVIALYRGGGASEKDASIVTRERRVIQSKCFSKGERMLYEVLYNTLWYGVKRLGYVAYPMFPAAIRRRMSGW